MIERQVETASRLRRLRERITDRTEDFDDQHALISTSALPNDPVEISDYEPL
jgi:hypothetical protein